MIEFGHVSSENNDYGFNEIYSMKWFLLLAYVTSNNFYDLKLICSRVFSKEPHLCLALIPNSHAIMMVGKIITTALVSIMVSTSYYSTMYSIYKCLPHFQKNLPKLSSNFHQWMHMSTSWWNSLSIKIILLEFSCSPFIAATNKTKINIYTLHLFTHYPAYIIRQYVTISCTTCKGGNQVFEKR